jgi:hypothetical protein
VRLGPARKGHLFFLHRSALPEEQEKWTYMKRFRLWQAAREVFLFPENFAYAEVLDIQSQIFKNTMNELLQSDITDDSAAYAYLNYLSSLEQVAKLELSGFSTEGPSRMLAIEPLTY